ncbi:hypothetical protein FPL04_17145 [Xanthomonas arboricola]|nr:hypothetical protein FPL04_17145 [Xanthomonas arboricola]
MLRTFGGSGLGNRESGLGNRKSGWAERDLQIANPESLLPATPSPATISTARRSPAGSTGGCRGRSAGSLRPGRRPAA